MSQRLLTWLVAGVTLSMLSACVMVPTRHGRVRVGVALPVPVIRIPIPGPVVHQPEPVPQPAPAPSYPSSNYPSSNHPAPASYPAPQPSQPPYTYPSAGAGSSAAAGSYAGAIVGTIRSIEGYGASGRSSGLRIVVDMDDRRVRAFDAPVGASWRVGERVRVEGGRLLRL
jgi:hypothetical protein